MTQSEAVPQDDDDSIVLTEPPVTCEGRCPDDHVSLVVCGVQGLVFRPRPTAMSWSLSTTTNCCRSRNCSRHPRQGRRRRSMIGADVLKFFPRIRLSLESLCVYRRLRLRITSRRRPRTTSRAA